MLSHITVIFSHQAGPDFSLCFKVKARLLGWTLQAGEKLPPQTQKWYNFSISRNHHIALYQEHKESAMDNPMQTGHLKTSMNHTNITIGKDLQDRHEQASAQLRRNFHLSWRIPLHQWIIYEQRGKEPDWRQTPLTHEHWHKLFFKIGIPCESVCHLCKRWELPPAMQQQPRTVASR